jgi:hypothetical protein
MQKKYIFLITLILSSILIYFYLNKEKKVIVTYQNENIQSLEPNEIDIAPNILSSNSFIECQNELQEYNLEQNIIFKTYNIKNNNRNLFDVSCKKIYNIEKRKINSDKYNYYLNDSKETENEMLRDKGYYPKDEWYEVPEELDIEYIDYDNKTISLFEDFYDENFEKEFEMDKGYEIDYKEPIYLDTKKIKDIVAFFFKDQINQYNFEEDIFFRQDDTDINKTFEFHDYLKNIQIKINGENHIFQIRRILLENSPRSKQRFRIGGQFNNNFNTNFYLYGNLNKPNIAGNISFEYSDFYSFKTFNDKGFIFRTKKIKD